MANSHTNEQRSFIVRKLAALTPPREIVRDFAAVYPATRCDENDVRRLDPANIMLPPDLHAAFQRERARIKTDPDSAPFADQQLRLVILSNDVQMYRGNNQPAEARLVLRQIAEELGIGGKGGGKPAPTGEPEIATITRTIVYPAPKEASA